MNTEDNKRHTFVKADRFLAMVLALLVLVLAFMSLHSGKTRNGYGSEAASPADFSLAVETTMPALVKVENEVLAGHPAIGGMGEPGEIAQVREGTGFFIDKEGLVLTNYHVVDGAQALKVVTRDRKTYPAELVGADALTDVALIRIKPDFAVSPAVLGNSDRLKAGQWVLAMGNPLGLEFFTTAGIISGFGPPGPGYIGFYDFIQVDVNIKPGNSGGPLLNAMGEVIGINNAYLGPGTGIGFAIPINRAKEVVAKLKKDGRISRGFLGIVGQPLNEGLAERLDLKDTHGALVSDVMEGSPAEAAGLRPGDVVLEFGGRPVADDRELEANVFGSPVDTKATLLVFRDGRKMELTAVLGELKEHSLITQRVIRQCGITLKELPEAMASRLGMKEAVGLLVLKVVPGCPAYEGGLRFGDVITKVEGRDITTVADFYRSYSQVKAGALALIQIYRGGRPMYLTVKQAEAP